MPRPAWLDPVPLRPAWILRSLYRRPGSSLLAAASLAGVVLVAATPSLDSLSRQAELERALDAAPSLRVTRLDATGFAPVPVEEARRAALSVRGVLSASARVWGIAARDGRAVMVEAGDPGEDAPGQSLAGPDGRVRVVKARAAEPDPVRGGLPRWIGAEADVRALLGLPDGTATDLALRVWQEAEEEAIRPAVAAAMPWPVRMATRGEEARAARVRLAREAGGDVLRLAPAVLALVLLVLAALRDGDAGRRQVALCRALGWTTADLARERLWASLAVGIPAVAAGLAAAWALAVGGVAPDLAALLAGAGAREGGAVPDAGAAALALAQVGALVLAPWLAASLVQVARAATADPAGMLDLEGDR